MEKTSLNDFETFERTTAAAVVKAVTDEWRQHLQVCVHAKGH